MSVRKIVKKGNIVVFENGGGFIEDTHTGKKYPFVERQGVYFIKVLVEEPDEGDAVDSVFARPGM